MSEEITKEELKQMTINMLHRQARTILEKERWLNNELSALQIDEQILVSNAKSFGGELSGSERDYELPLILRRNNQEHRKTEMDQLIGRALEFVKDEYEDEKYQGREIRHLFGVLFGMISKEAELEFEKRYYNE